MYFQWVVPKNIYTPPMEGFLVCTPHPPGNSSLAIYISSRLLALRSPLPLGIFKLWPSWGGGGGVWILSGTTQSKQKENSKEMFPSFPSAYLSTKMPAVLFSIISLQEPTLSFLLLQLWAATAIVWFQTPEKIFYLILLTLVVWCLWAQLLCSETEKLHPLDKREDINRVSCCCKQTKLVYVVSGLHPTAFCLAWPFRWV